MARARGGGLRGLGNLPCYLLLLANHWPQRLALEHQTTGRGLQPRSGQAGKLVVVSGGLRLGAGAIAAALAALNNPDLPLTGKLPSLAINGVRA